MFRNLKIFEYLNLYAHLLPIPMYWLDQNQNYLGSNKLFVDKKDDISSSKPDILFHDFYPKEAVPLVLKRHKESFQMAKITTLEESFENAKSGVMQHYKEIIIPLYEHEKIIGTLGILIDVALEKEANYLREENEKITNTLQKANLHTKNQIKKLIYEIVHDIRSPLAGLLMILKSRAEEIPLDLRISLKEITASFDDIVGRLLKCKKTDMFAQSGNRKPLIASLLLRQLFAEKNHQYRDLPIKFKCEFNPLSNFASIKVESTSFKQMIANLIDNAVESLSGKDGKISLMLDLDNEKVKIHIQDNGKGMSPAEVDQIVNNVAMVHDDEQYGLGLIQVREILKRNDGEFLIESKVGKGTKITLVFPRVESLTWIISEIGLTKGDTVIILDGDPSSWKSRFKAYSNDINFEYFDLAEVAMDFISASLAKNKLLLIANFESLKQELSGLQMIEQTEIKRSILVTSHYKNQIIRELADKAGTKILPKELTEEIPIKIYMEVNLKEVKNNIPLRKADLVIIDDNAIYVDSLALFFRGKIVEKYYNPLRFLDHVTQYPKDTKICIDNDLCHKITGISLAKQLKASGYTNLYILSGKDFSKHEIPEGLRAILKTDIESIKKIMF